MEALRTTLPRTLRRETLAPGRGVGRCAIAAWLAVAALGLAGVRVHVGGATPPAHPSPTRGGAP